MRSYFSFVKSRFFSNKLGVIGFVVIVFLVFVAVFADFIANDKPILCIVNGKLYFPVFYDKVDYSSASFKIMPIVPYSPYKMDFSSKLLPPFSKHLLGTDDLGRDVLARIIHGTRVSITVGIVAMGTAFVIGVVLGLLAGYYGGIVDIIISKLIEVVMTFPTLFLILTILAFLPPNIYNIMFVIGLTGWTGVARLVRAETFKVMSSDFVKISKVMGAPDIYIMFRHVLINAINPAVVSLVFGVAGAILVESSLSFLGLGVQPPMPSWGNILLTGSQYIDYAWWLALFPGVAIFITVTSLNLLGEALRDAMDPRVVIESA
jgi:peptide/nickel transport system permease protein